MINMFAMKKDMVVSLEPSKVERKAFDQGWNKGFIIGYGSAIIGVILGNVVVALINKEA